MASTASVGLRMGFMDCMKAKAQNDHMHTKAMKVNQIDSLPTQISG